MNRWRSSWKKGACAALAILAWSVLWPLGSARAGEVGLAVAANFLQPAREIGAAFAAKTGHRVRISAGPTGLLYAQISQGAPFDVFLAADQERARRAVEAGHAVAGSRFVYATGRLVLYSATPGLFDDEGVLRKGAFDRLAIANPATAPYGVAAMETLAVLGVRETLKARIVRGNSIAQTYQFVATRNAELGFVALSQVIGRPGGSRWIVPEDLHRPIAQDAVLLTRGANKPAARAFLSFLRGREAGAVIAKFGYRAGA